MVEVIITLLGSAASCHLDLGQVEKGNPPIVFVVFIGSRSIAG